MLNPKTHLALLTGCLITFAPVESSFASIPDESTTIDIKQFQCIKPADNSLQTKEFFAKYFPNPGSLTPTTDMSMLGQQFQSNAGQKITDRFLESDLFKKSSIGKLNADVQKMTSNVSFSVNDPVMGTHHEFKFNIKPAERKAIIDYKGFFETKLTYMSDTNVVNVSFQRPLSKVTMLSLTGNSYMSQQANDGRVTVTYTF